MHELILDQTHSILLALTNTPVHENVVLSTMPMKITSHYYISTSLLG